MNQRSPCDAARLPWSAGSNRSPWASPPRPAQEVDVDPTAHGTRASSGHTAASAASLESKIGRTSSPLLPPAVLLKKAPAVSPAKPLTDRSPASMMPAMLTPEPKTYWSAVPRGQMPPPTVDDPVAQIVPSEKTRHCTRFTEKTFTALANRRNPVRPGLGAATAASDRDEYSARASATAAARRKARTRTCGMKAPWVAAGGSDRGSREA